MAARLGSDVVIMHLPDEPTEKEANAALWAQLRRTFDDLEPFARRHGVRIAPENGHFDTIEKALSLYDPGYVGLCYDSGHGNTDGHGLDHLDKIKDRLVSLHLHDNDGTADQHKLVFSGTVDWPRLARIIAESSYHKWVSMETTMGNAGIADEMEFLAKAFETGTAFSRMVDECKRCTGAFRRAE
jgi:sugar phosphate isomerase/epimerase